MVAEDQEPTLLSKGLPKGHRSTFDFVRVKHNHGVVVTVLKLDRKSFSCLRATRRWCMDTVRDGGGKNRALRKGVAQAGPHKLNQRVPRRVGLCIVCPREFNLSLQCHPGAEWRVVRASELRPRAGEHGVKELLALGLCRRDGASPRGEDHDDAKHNDT